LLRRHAEAPRNGRGSVLVRMARTNLNNWRRAMAARGRYDTWLAAQDRRPVRRSSCTLRLGDTGTSFFCRCRTGA